MHFGLKLFNNKKTKKEQFEKIINYTNSHMNVKLNKFKFNEKSTEKSKNITGVGKALPFFDDKKYFSFSIETLENDIDSIYANMLPRNECILTYDINLQFLIEDINLAISLFFDIVKIIEPYYGFIVYNNSFNKFIEELSFVPVSNSWETDISNEVREKYLFSLQEKRYDIGKIIAQVYPVNYFLTSENVVILNNLKLKLNNDWVFEEKGLYTIVKYKDVIPWEDFEMIKNKIKLDQ
jgi:hypothetical protein